MISLSLFADFWVDYFKNNKYPEQRFGQAFYNTHVHDGIANSELFYTEDLEKAKTIIFDKYVEIPNQKIMEPMMFITQRKTPIDILEECRE